MDKRLCTNWEQVSAVFDNVDEGEVLKKKEAPVLRALAPACQCRTSDCYERPPTAMNVRILYYVHSVPHRFGISSGSRPYLASFFSELVKMGVYHA